MGKQEYLDGVAPRMARWRESMRDDAGRWTGRVRPLYRRLVNVLLGYKPFGANAWIEEQAQLSQLRRRLDREAAHTPDGREKA